MSRNETRKQLEEAKNAANVPATTEDNSPATTENTPEDKATEQATLSLDDVISKTTNKDAPKQKKVFLNDLRWELLAEVLKAKMVPGDYPEDVFDHALKLKDDGNTAATAFFNAIASRPKPANSYAQQSADYRRDYGQVENASISDPRMARILINRGVGSEEQITARLTPDAMLRYVAQS